MWSVGALSFFVPWALAGLAILPMVWWLLRLNPPKPRIILFPPIFLLQRLLTQRSSTARMPPWLIFLRLILVTLIITGIAGPVWNVEGEFDGTGPIYIIIDDGWSASKGWEARKKALRTLLDHAERTDRPLVLTTTAPMPEGAIPTQPDLLTATDAHRLIDSLQPKPWHTDREAAVDALLASEVVKKNQAGDVIWLSDGLEEIIVSQQPKSNASKLSKRLQRIGSLTVISESPEDFPLVLSSPKIRGSVLEVNVQRVGIAESQGIQVRALSDDGEILDILPLVFPAGAAIASGRLDMPSEYRNKLARLEISGSRSAGGVVLVDERWRQRPVGLLNVANDRPSQPLLDAFHYLGKAIAPYAEVRKGETSELLKRGLAVLIITDLGRLDPVEMSAIRAWMDKGGIVLRFAGPRLARDAGNSDTLLPVQLRRGGRNIGGALSWQQPESLAPFPVSSPFYGLAIPEDVKIHRQVLAQPSLDLAEKTWARLKDGTPLVTASRRGQGWVVLVHTTANAEWSNLAFSGLYLGMLKRLIRLSQGMLSEAGARPLGPIVNLDAFGQLVKPFGGATAIPEKAFGEVRVSPRHPPGVYGAGTTRRALNLSNELTTLGTIGPLPPGVSIQSYFQSPASELRPWLLGAAGLLFLVDLIVSMWVRGLFGVTVLGPGALIFMACFAVTTASAEDDFARKNSLQTRMAFVITGDLRVDRISEAGLGGLNMILWRRTAAELGQPQGVNPAIDELSLFPLLYWPVIPGYTLPQGGAARVTEYLRKGGVILFDTREQASDLTGSTLAKLSRELQIPPLVPVASNHVLTRSFYLLKDFPGRWTGGTVWVEKAGERINDGVSPVIAGSHDWVGAWAVDEHQRPLFPVVPGGERQREVAYRFGVNLIMYALTGNYKADQVHMPAIIKRLGQ